MAKSRWGYNLFFSNDTYRQSNVSDCRMCHMGLVRMCSSQERRYAMSISCKFINNKICCIE